MSQKCPRCKIGSLQLKNGKYQCDHCHYEQQVKKEQKTRALTEEIETVGVGYGYSGIDDQYCCD